MARISLLFPESYSYFTRQRLLQIDTFKYSKKCCIRNHENHLQRCSHRKETFNAIKFSLRKKLLLFIFTFSKVTLVFWDKLCCVKKTSPGKILLFLVAGKWNWWWRVYSNLCLLCSHHPCILCLHHPRLLCFYYPRLLYPYERPHSFYITHKFYQSGIKNHYFF